MLWLVGASLLSLAALGADAGAGEPRPGGLSRDTLAALPGYVFPSGREQLRLWALHVTGPGAIAGNLAAASWRQWVSDEPSEWKDDGRGFAKRFGMTSLSTATSETSVSLVSALMRQDAEYYRAPSAGFASRLGHAVTMTFVARDTDGDRVFSPAKTFSYFTGPAVTQAGFYPGGFDATDVLVSGAYTLLINASLQMAREFVLGAPAWRSRPSSTR